jgi:hypothetical protein
MTAFLVWTLCQRYIMSSTDADVCDVARHGDEDLSIKIGRMGKGEVEYL